MTDHPTTPVQYVFRRAEQVQPGVANVTSARRHSGDLDRAALHEALQHLGRAYPILSSGLPRVGRFGASDWRRYFLDYRQRVRDVELELVVEPSEELALAAGRAPFDVRRGPLARMLCSPLPEGGTLLALSTNHVAVDAWSLQLLWDALSTCYQAIIAGREVALVPSFTFGEYAEKQLNDRVTSAAGRSLDAWISYLAGFRSVDREAATRGDLDSVHRSLARPRAGDALAVSLASFTQALRSVLGISDVLLHVPFAGRMRPHERTIVGPLAHPLPFRANPEATRVADLLQSAKTFRSLMFSHGSVTLDRMGAAVPDVILPPSFMLRLYLDGGKLRVAGSAGAADDGDVATSLTAAPIIGSDWRAAARHFGGPYSLCMDVVWHAATVDLRLTYRTSFASRGDADTIVERTRVALDDALG